MKISQMYSESKGYKLAISIFGIMLFALTFLEENLLLKIVAYTMLPFCLFYIIFFIYKLTTLKREIKTNSIKIITIEINDLLDIKNFSGIKSPYKHNYYGIKILSKKKSYFYYYKTILHETSNFILFNKLLNQKTIRIEIYKKSRVIKRILTKM